ncbi:hypothetical protein JNW90_28660 [Micromonospora sp. STR1s_5]|nr:hypothetical protein [Micromonospora sp. STR1s_5]
MAHATSRRAILAGLATTPAIPAAATTKPALQRGSRKALEAYAAWLFYERRLLCHYLWPHYADADSFVLCLNAGFGWHLALKGADEARRHPEFPRRSGPRRGRGRLARLCEAADEAYRVRVGLCPIELDMEAIGDIPLFSRVRQAARLRLSPGHDYIGPDTWTNRCPERQSARSRRTCQRSTARLEQLHTKSDAYARSCRSRTRGMRSLKPARVATGISEASRAQTAARNAMCEAETAVLALPAATAAGVAVKARLAAYRLAEWKKSNPKHYHSEYLTAVVDAALAAGGEA